MNGFTHLKDIRFPDAKANILLRSGAIEREHLVNASNSIIELKDVHYGVAKRINDSTAMDIKHSGEWVPVMCGDTDTLYNIYTMCEEKVCEHYETPEVAVKTAAQEENHDCIQVDDEPETTESVEEVSETEEELVDDSVEVVEEIPGQETIEDVITEISDEETDIVDEPETAEDEVIESEQPIVSDSVESSDTTTTIPNTQTNTNNNQGNARRQVNINNNHSAKRRHR